MEFCYQARFANSRLSYYQRDLALALTRALPAA
jgi:hypothetical protein